MLVGYSMADWNGTVLQIDQPVADLLCRSRREIEGRSYLAITHPADRPRNAAFVSNLQPGAGPTSIRKRYITGDQEEIWVNLETARLGDNAAAGRLVGTFSLILPEENPRRLWRQAKRLLNLYDARDAAMGAELFSDNSWTLMLSIYLAEAEGRAVDTAQLAAQTAMPRSVLSRYATLLKARGFIIYGSPAAEFLELTDTGLRVLENLLAKGELE